ncbi:MAG: hypothetical protein QOC65_310 [Sphingomonadales bacterium]|nr:hypothetical protein [Sphingomonadales bacterium]
MRALILAASLLAIPAALPAQTQQAAVAAPSAADQQLRRLYTEEWRWRLNEQARVPGPDGGAWPDDHLPRVDAASQRARLVYWERVLAELGRIPLDQLSAEERINARIFRTVIEEMANEVRFRTYEAPFNADSFFWGELAPYSTLQSAEEYRRYIGRLRDVPRYFRENIANMRAGLARGFSVPRVSLEGRDRTMEPYLAEGEANPLWAPFARMPSSMQAAEQERLREAARAAISEAVVPAYRDLLTMFRGEYLPRTRTSLAATAMPDGRAYYQAMIRTYTTLDLTPEQIHAIGLSEVARIRAEMEATMRRANFAGTLPEFIHFLRTDPQFYARTPRELLAFASYVVKRADGALGETFGTLPRYRHGIVPVPDAIAPIYTAGRGGLENCLFNTWNLPQRPLYAIPALALHECTPGHSFQAALALEAPERPDFRRDLYFSGYGEGWGLYVEWLGTQMGIYETPYEDFGRLTYEMWRAARLVIDTGIHAFGWSRERALAYLRDNTALSEHEVTTEVDRYISWPGQALAYKLGELQIRRHRAEAEAALGEHFDQRRFHDAILALGSVPLPVLEDRMRRFIEEERARIARGG